MDLALNISKYRKERKMTQEELADTLGVTFAAVSKWERGIATPDISLILQMASLFEISLDALFGYKMEENKIDNYIKQIEDYLKEGKYDETIPLTNNYLAKYPNNFKMVNIAANVYSLAAIKTRHDEYIKKGIELYEHSISLLSENDDNDINETTIRGNMGYLYIKSGEVEKGITILKKYNANGMFDHLIAYSYTNREDFNPHDAEPFLNSAFSSNVSDFLIIMMSYANYYKKLNLLDKGIESLLMARNLLKDLKEKSDILTFYDKIVSYLDAYLAVFYHLNGDDKKSIEHLYLAYEMASLFDKKPINTVKNVKFYTKEYEDKCFIDDILGKTAIESIVEVIKDYDELYRIWEEIENEKR